jgi:hypothetical protein
VYDLMLLQILACLHKLKDVALGFQLSQSFSAPYQFIERLVVANFKYDVHIFFIFKVLEEMDNILIIEGLMNFDLTG